MGVHGSNGYHYQIKVKGTVVSEYTNSTANSKGDYTVRANGLKVGDIISFVVIARSSGRNTTFDYGRVSWIKPKPENRGLPRNLTTIGNTGYITIHGIHTNENYYGGVMQEKSTDATTGSITLGNAVGFITVNFNGEIIKIPYYGE